MSANLRTRAAQMLLLATTLWGLSFPVMKALTASQQADGPVSSWFLSALCVVVRFGVAALAMLLFAGTCRTLSQFNKLEWEQGLGLGLFGGAGILLQVDGLNYTNASTSAFLTQGYCVLLPLWAAVRHRQLPGPRLVVSCVLVVIGVLVLAKVDLTRFHMGRGELETILSSVLFTGQILWLERPRYAANDVTHFSFVMFAVMALVALPVTMATAPSGAAWIRGYDAWPEWGLMAILILPCTFGAYMLMNHWQRHVPATHAGLIYCLEPVFASLYALFLPGWFARWAGGNYGNEELTPTLWWGGGLIVAANLLLHLPLRRVLRPAGQTAGA